MATVLIVDDEESMAWVLAHLLRKDGHTPIIASNGEAALREAQRAHPDLILLDLGLPDIPGAEILKRLKRQPETAQIPVVVVSGQPDAAAVVAESGAHAVAAILRKPLLFPELRTVVEAVLDAPAGWEAGTAPPIQDRRVRLIYRLVTEGSNALVRKVCLRLDTDRAQQWGSTAPDIPSWTELARLARGEGLLSDAEATLLAEGPAVVVAGHYA
jgi:DNA-binding response OmpR family regulator